jgi:hypothetical protein
MKRLLNFQIQGIQSGNAATQIELLLHALNAHARPRKIKLSVDFQPNRDYCNVLVHSRESPELWKRFAKFVAQNPSEFEWMTSRWIVVLQGKAGWDDYLLVAHFSPSVRLDTEAGKG